MGLLEFALDGDAFLILPEYRIQRLALVLYSDFPWKVSLNPMNADTLSTLLCIFSSRGDSSL